MSTLRRNGHEPVPSPGAGCALAGAIQSTLNWSVAIAFFGFSTAEAVPEATVPWLTVQSRRAPAKPQGLLRIGNHQEENRPFANHLRLMVFPRVRRWSKKKPESVLFYHNSSWSPLLPREYELLIFQLCVPGAGAPGPVRE